MAVRHVMRDLPDSPASGPVRRVELLIREVFHCRAQICRRLINGIYQTAAVIGGIWPPPLEAADRILQVHGSMVSSFDAVCDDVRYGFTVTSMSFAGLKVISFESRRASEMAQLIRKQQGEPIVVPS